MENNARKGIIIVFLWISFKLTLSQYVLYPIESAEGSLVNRIPFRWTLRALYGAEIKMIIWYSSELSIDLNKFLEPQTYFSIHPAQTYS